MSSLTEVGQVSDEARAIVEQIRFLNTVQDLDFVIEQASTIRKVQIALIRPVQGIGKTDPELLERCEQLLEKSSESLSDSDAGMLTCGILVGQGLVPFRSRDVTEKLSAHGSKLANISKTMTRLRGRGFVVISGEIGQGRHSSYLITQRGLGYINALVDRRL